MTTVEIIYNVFSAIVAVGIGVGFTFYARRALDGIQSAEAARRHEPVAVPTTGSASVPRNRNGGSSSVPADVV